MSTNNSDNQLNKIEEKINSFSEVLQNFGLNLIQNMGKITRAIHILTDKIDNLSKATMDVKGLLPQINKVIEKQDILESEIDLLKSLIKKFAFKTKTEGNVEVNDKKLENKSTPKDILENLKALIDKTKDGEEIKALLNESKESIFEITGGHRILYEIQQTINDLKNLEVAEDDMKKILNEKIDVWINKL